MTGNSLGPDGARCTLERLEHLLDRYGADPTLWPTGDRPGAQGLIETDPVARALFDATAHLDRVMAADREPAAVPDGLRSRILAAAPGPIRQRPGRWRTSLSALWPFDAGWQPASALVAAGVIGFALGLSGISAGGSEVSFDSAVDSLVLGPTVVEDTLL